MSDKINDLELEIAKAIVSNNTIDDISGAIGLLQKYRQAIYRKAIHSRTGEAPPLIDDSGRVA